MSAPTIDLFAKFTQPDTVVLGRYDAATDPKNAARMERNAARLARIRLTDGRRLTVFRIPMPPSSAPIFPTYTNALTINDAFVMPIYEGFPDMNEEAERVFEAALPEGTAIEKVRADDVIEVGGAVHCTTMQVSTLPTNWKPTDNNAPGRRLAEGAVGVTPNLNGHQAAPSVQRLKCPTQCCLTSIGGCLVEHRAPETLVVRLHHDGRSVDLPMTNDASPLNERRLTTDAFTGTDPATPWTIEVESERFNFSGALLEGWVRTPDTIN